MRAFRTSMTTFATFAAFATSIALGAQLAGCGGDDDNQGGPQPAPLPDAGPTPTGPTLTVSTSRAKLYLGQTAKIDGPAVAAEITSKHTWTVVAAPSESAITTSAIQDAATASPSIKPDRLGLYTLQLSGENADGAAASVLVIIEAIDAPVFARDVHATGDPTGEGAMTFTSSTVVAGAYGTAARAVDCPVTAPTSAEADDLTRPVWFLGTRSGAASGDTWEGPPGTPSRVAFTGFQLEPISDAVFKVSSHLTVATSTSECGSPEAKVLEAASVDAEMPRGPATPPKMIHNARFSPDGTRIAYMKEVDGRGRLSTIGFDGANQRDLSPTVSGGDGRLDPDASTPLGMGGEVFSMLGPIPPRWKDATHIGWISFVGENAATLDRSAWELWVVEDKPGATAELAMRCTGSGLTHFDFLPDGTIVAAARRGELGSDEEQVPPMDLLVYRANASTKACEIARNLTNNAQRGIARDFGLSPDKSTVAFFAGVGLGLDTGDPTDNVTYLATVPVDGSRPPTRVPGSLGPGEYGTGPRWAAGGTVITYGQRDVASLATGGSEEGSFLVGSRLLSIPAAGGDPTVVASPVAGLEPSAEGELTLDYHVSYGIGQGCTAATGNVSNSGILAAGVLGVGALVARRRRSSAQ